MTGELTILTALGPGDIVSSRRAQLAGTPFNETSRTLKFNETNSTIRKDRQITVLQDLLRKARAFIVIGSSAGSLSAEIGTRNEYRKHLMAEINAALPQS